MPVFEPVAAVVRGLEVLKAVNRMGEATITELHRVTGLHKATVLRMLDTLIHSGYVARLSDKAAYVATGKCLLLSSGFERQDRLEQIASPMLTEFRRELGWPSNFAVFDGDAMILSLVSHEFGVLSLNLRAGTRVPMLASAVGRAYLAFSSREKRERILSRLALSQEPFDRPARERKSCLAMLERFREQGYSTSEERYLEAIYGTRIWVIGTPVLAHGDTVAAINVLFLRSALSLEEGVAGFLPRLQRVAEMIGHAIEQDFGAAVESASAPAAAGAREGLAPALTPRPRKRGPPRAARASREPG